MTEKPDNKAALNDEIARVLREMATNEPESEQYASMALQLKMLHELKTTESKPRVDPNTVATIAANLVGILMIVANERTHIITSKALGFVLKLR